MKPTPEQKKGHDLAMAFVERASAELKSLFPDNLPHRLSAASVLLQLIGKEAGLNDQAIVIGVARCLDVPIMEIIPDAQDPKH